MTFRFHKVSDHGTGNPVVARLGPQIFNLIELSKFSKEKQEAICEGYFKLKDRFLKCFEIKELLRKKADETIQDARNATPQKHAQQTPFLISLESNVENFLYEGKNILRDLTVIVNQFFETSFAKGAADFSLKGAKNNGRILKWAQVFFGPNDVLTKALISDQPWIQELIDKRNAVEHPDGYSGKLVIQNFEISPAGELFSPVWYRAGQAPSSILVDIEAFYHNLFTFSEELAVIAIQKNVFNPSIVIVEIPEAQRDPACPIRFRGDLAQGVTVP